MIVPFLLKAQEGFIQTYDLDHLGMTFHNVQLIENDTLIVCGSVKPEVGDSWGVLFMKMDTLGNIYDYKMHFDSLGDSYTFGQNYSVVKTTDNGYILTGQLFYKQYPFLIKLDINGELEFVQEYPDDNVFAIRQTDIIELEDGYIAIGRKQQKTDHKWDAYIMKTDLKGNKIREVKYGSYNVKDIFTSINKINEKELLLTSLTTTSNSNLNTLDDKWYRNGLITIDTSGYIIKEIHGDKEYYHPYYEFDSYTNLTKTTDNRWISIEAKIIYEDLEYWTQQPQIVKRGKNFNIIWRATFEESTYPANYLTDIELTPDGGYVAVGNYHNADLSMVYTKNYITKINSEGDKQWSRIDVIPVINHGNHYSGSIVVLESGSIIICGKADRYDPLPSKSLGYIIKVDKNGCIIPECNPTVSGTNIASLVDGFEIYPNPPSDFIQVKGEGEFNLEITNLEGQTILIKEDNNTTSQLNIEHYPAGIYFLKIKKGNQILTKKIVKQ